MKVLVATSETRGQRKNDFGHATDGEIVVEEKLVSLATQELVKRR